MNLSYIIYNLAREQYVCGWHRDIDGNIHVITTKKLEEAIRFTGRNSAIEYLKEMKVDLDFYWIIFVETIIKPEPIKEETDEYKELYSMSSKVGKMSSYANELLMKDYEITQLKSTIDSQNKEITELYNSISRLNQQVRDLKGFNNKQNKEITDLRYRYQEYDKTLRLKDETIDVLNIKIKGLENKLTEIRRFV